MLMSNVHVLDGQDNDQSYLYSFMYVSHRGGQLSVTSTGFAHLHIIDTRRAIFLKWVHKKVESIAPTSISQSQYPAGEKKNCWMICKKND